LPGADGGGKHLRSHHRDAHVGAAGNELLEDAGRDAHRVEQLQVLGAQQRRLARQMQLQRLA
jgi:hypothetical protein